MQELEAGEPAKPRLHCQGTGEVEMDEIWEIASKGIEDGPGGNAEGTEGGGGAAWDDSKPEVDVAVGPAGEKVIEAFKQTLNKRVNDIFHPCKLWGLEITDVGLQGF